MLAIIHIRAYRLTFKGYHVHKQSADLMTALGNECVPAAIHIMLIISHLTDDFPTSYHYTSGLMSATFEPITQIT